MTDFLQGVANQAAAAGGSFIDSVLQAGTTGLTDSLFGGAQARRNASRYNMVQDTIYPQDSRRMNDRLNMLYPGTTPWERLGVQPSNPGNPIPESPEQAAFLPLQLAKIQQDTALKTTEMNNQTARDVTSMTTGTQVTTNEATNRTTLEATRLNNQTAKAIAEYAQTGPEAVQRTALAAANTIVAKLQGPKIEAETANTRAQTGFLGQQTLESQARIKNLGAQTENTEIASRVLQSKDVRDAIATVASLIPRETWTAGPYTRTGLAQTDPLLGLAKALADASAAQRFDRADAYMKDLSPHDLDLLAKSALGVAGGVRSALDAASSIAGTALKRAKTLTPSEY